MENLTKETLPLGLAVDGGMCGGHEWVATRDKCQCRKCGALMVDGEVYHPSSKLTEVIEAALATAKQGLLPEHHADYLEAMADVILESSETGKLEAKLVMEAAAKFIRSAFANPTAWTNQNQIDGINDHPKAGHTMWGAQREATDIALYAL